MGILVVHYGGMVKSWVNQARGQGTRKAKRKKRGKIGSRCYLREG